MTALNGLTVWSRLLGAFVGVSLLAILGGAAGLYVFHEVATVLDEVIEQRMPSALAALELSRQAERIAAAAPSLLAARVQSDRTAIAGSIFGEVHRMETLLADLKVPTAAAGSLAEVELAVAGLHRNLESLDTVVSHRIVVGEHKQALLDRLAAVSVTGERVAQPASRVLESQVSALRRAANGEPQSSNAPTILELAEGIATNMAMQHAHGELTALNEALLRASDASSADLRLLIYPLERSLAALDKDVGSVDLRQRARLQQVVDEFRRLTEGSDSLPEARTAELTLVADGERLLAENLALSKGLTGAVDTLVAAARDEIRSAGSDALAAQRVGRGILLAVVLLILVSSGLIVWRYVNRSLIARLKALSDSMLAVAGGNLRVVLPEPRGGDEIAEMTRALVVFRDTAVEIEANGLREIALARQRLVDAIESISEGFALFDEHDHLVLCNRNYREMAWPGSPETIVPGISFETIILRFTDEVGACEPSGRHGDAFVAADDGAGKNDGWVASRKAAHLRLDGSPTLHHHQDRWLQIRERHAGTSGGVVVVASDVSELKQRELQLELALHLINEELTTARRLQLSMVPHDFPEWSKEQPVEIYAIMEPAREVGGDLYDFFLAAPGQMCFVVGDVSGKGAPAALFMARTRSLVRATVSIWHQATGDMLSPSDIAQAVNRELCLDNPERMFVSLFLGILDLETGEVDYINAGHPPPYLLSETVGSAAIEEVPDLPLGVRSRVQFRARSLYLRDEEALCLVTDGVLDAVNAGETFFGKARLLETLSSVAGEAPTAIAARVRAAIDDFANGTPRFDDVTLLALRWLPSGTRYHSRPVGIESEADPSNATSGDGALTATAVARYS